MKIISSSIKLSNVRFFSYHGVMPQEKVVGNEFEIDLEIFFPALEGMQSGDLDQTINYALVYDLLKEEMNVPCELLEHVCYRILQKLRLEFPQITKAIILITKLMPPIQGFQGKGVSFSAEVEY